VLAAAANLKMKKGGTAEKRDNVLRLAEGGENKKRGGSLRRKRKDFGTKPALLLLNLTKRRHWVRGKGVGEEARPEKASPVKRKQPRWNRIGPQECDTYGRGEAEGQKD